jgi:hypothetical protein
LHTYDHTYDMCNLKGIFMFLVTQSNYI